MCVPTTTHALTYSCRIQTEVIVKTKHSYTAIDDMLMKSTGGYKPVWFDNTRGWGGVGTPWDELCTYLSTTVGEMH